VSITSSRAGCFLGREKKLIEGEGESLKKRMEEDARNWEKSRRSPRKGSLPMESRTRKTHPFVRKDGVVKRGGGSLGVCQLRLLGKVLLGWDSETTSLCGGGGKKGDGKERSIGRTRSNREIQGCHRSVQKRAGVFITKRKLREARGGRR